MRLPPLWERGRRVGELSGLGGRQGGSPPLNMGGGGGSTPTPHPHPSTRPPTKNSKTPKTQKTTKNQKNPKTKKPKNVRAFCVEKYYFTVLKKQKAIQKARAFLGFLVFLCFSCLLVFVFWVRFPAGWLAGWLAWLAGWPG